MLNRLEMLRIFCVAAECKNFKEAAVRLHMSPQAVTRAIQELEALSGEMLFHRNTRQTRITHVGAALAVRARQSVEGVDQLFQSFQEDQQEQVRGTVTLTAAVALGEDYLIPVLADIQQRYPLLQTDVRLSDATADTVDEQIDIGLRLGHVRNASMIARRVAQAGFVFVGTPALIARCGAPQTLEDLDKLPVTAVIDPNTGRPWPWFLAEGQFWHPRQPAIQVTDTRAECRAMLRGMGFGQLIGFMAHPYLQSGQLQRVLPQLDPAPWDLYIYRPQRGPVPPRIRVVYDALCAAFSDPARFPGMPASI